MKTFLLLLLVFVLPVNLSFEPFHEEDGVKVTIARTAEKWPWMRGEGEVDAPPERIHSILKELERYPQIFEDHIEATTVLERAADTLRVHVVWPVPFPFSDRDGIVRYSFSTRGTSKVIEWEGDERPGDPETEGVRIEVIRGETIIEPIGETRSRVTYTYYGDLGGEFWESARNKAWRTEPVVYIESIRRAVASGK